jgi:hypothetical protein
MKKAILILMIMFAVLPAFNEVHKIEPPRIEIQKSKYHEGFEDGHCEGWKDERGVYAHCPHPPYPPHPAWPKSLDSYRDGYNDGFKRGVSDARR